MKILHLSNNKENIKRVLEALEEIGVEWCSGDKATKSGDVEIEFLIYNQIGDETLTYASPMSDIDHVIKRKHKMYSTIDSFLLDIRNEVGCPKETQTTDNSRWNAKCHCGANAYDSGFSIECERGCYK